MSDTPTLDALIPGEMIQKAEKIGVTKANLPLLKMFLLAILAGVYIAIGAIFCTVVTTGAAAMPYGVSKLLGGLVFCAGLILVVVGGAELFTGNSLMIIALANSKISWGRLLLNWLVVYLGNLAGSIFIAWIMFVTRQYTSSGGALGLNILTIGNNKTGLAFDQALALGVMCNLLVCLAVWMCYSARTVADKVLAIVFPITAFVAAGFEHSVANMYFVPIALFVKGWGSPDFFTAIGKTPADFPNLTWQNFFVANLLPVTIGNILGGAMLVGLVYWWVYLRKNQQPTSPENVK